MFMSYFLVSVCVCRSQGMSWIGEGGQFVNTHEDQTFEWTMHSQRARRAVSTFKLGIDANSG